MINLLPPEVKHRYKLYSSIYIVIISYVLILAVLGLSAAALATHNLNQGVSLTDKRAKIDEIKKARQKNQQLTNKAIFVQDRLMSIKQYTESNTWSKTLSTIAPATPSDVQLTDIQLASQADQSVTITLGGQTKDRRLIILFKDKLAATDQLGTPTITAINETKGTDDQKSFTFTIVTKITAAKETK